MAVDGSEPVGTNDFVSKTLGPWSSHPEMMARQKRILWWLGLSPFWVGILAALVILTGYRSSYFSAVHDWQTFLSACSGWWGKIKLSVLVLALAGFVSAGFTAMLNLLWMVGVTIGKSNARITERDHLPFPAWLVGMGALLWLVPFVTWAMRRVLTAVDWRLNLAVQLASNFLCLFPMAVLLVWTKWARRPARPEADEVVRHPVPHLLAALAMFAAAAVVLFSQKPGFFDRAVAKWFPWLAQCGVDSDRAYGWVRLALVALLGIGGVFHCIVWRLRTEIRLRKKSRGRKDSASEGSNEDGKAAGNGIPAGARKLLANLPAGVTADASGPHGEQVWRKQVGQTSPFKHGGGDEYGLGYLLGGGLTPTEDQAKFFVRFVESFDGARKEFGERTDFKEDPNRKDPKRADILLTGEYGTGRTEILLAAALYAAVVRGQRVLFLCADSEGAGKLAERASKRLAWLGMDVYVSADVLKRNELDRWIDPMTGTMPPDLLFSTPETVENLLFANPSTRKRETASEIRTLLTGFGAVFVDDILEMPPSFRAHAAFLLDKMKLLQAAEPVLAQYVVASTPLQKPDGVETFGKRLFGVAGFDRNDNVLELKPRPCGDYWFGTLRVARGAGGEGISLDEAVRELVRISSEGGCRTLLYQKGMSADAKAEFLDGFGGTKGASGVSVASRYRELEELEEVPDNVFYLSLASGEAGTALRLNLDGGDPVFFRISMDGEEDPEAPRQYGLVPDETALSLRVHHLRNVLQFIDDHVPVPDETWARFQITMNHPCIRELVPGASPGTVAVSWLHDDLTGDAAYGADALWPYLVLETPVSYGSGMDVDFNVLPDDRGAIWKDANGGGRLLLADSEAAIRERGPGGLALWRNDAQTIGQSDLAHSDELVYVGTDEFTVADAVLPKNGETERYAVQFQCQYRHGGDAEFIHPVRRLSWQIPLGELELPGVQVLDEIATFSAERKSSPTCRVDGTLSGVVNLRGKSKGFDGLSYSYDAYLSCFVLLPSFEPGSGSKISQVQACLDGAWTTTAEGGFSFALTHAFAAALRRNIADWPFFAVAPAFFTEGRQDSVGAATVWLVEPANSGRTVQPLLRRLMQESSEFRQNLYSEAKRVLETCESLQELRLASRLAFDGEADSLDADDKRKALGILGTLLDREKSEDWMARRLREREEERKKRKDRKVESRSSVVFTPEEREFDKVVVEALKRFDGTIDVSKFAVESGWDYDKISDLFNDVLWNHPEVFWVSKSGRHQWWRNSDGKITRYVITDLPYAFGAEDLPRKKAEFDTAVGKALEDVPDDADDVTKALLLHDFIVRNCEYDVEAKNRHDQSPLARTAYSVLVRHSAVCEGYAMAYRCLLSRVGIESEEVLSDSMNHCWNYVRLAGNWYHADVTWDDPVYSGCKPSDDRVSREHFLLSDAAIGAKGHHDWNVRGLPPATDETYDKRNWDAKPGRKGGGDVPWTVFRDHALFRAKERGNVKRCRGKVHLRVFFVDDADSSWDDSARDVCRGVLADVARTLEREAGPAAGLEVSWSAENRKTDRSCSDMDLAHAEIPALLGVSGRPGVSKIQNEFKKARGCDEAPMLFVWNRQFRSCCEESDSPRRHAEWATIGLDDDIHGDASLLWGAILHELLHLFGAVDYYYPDAVKEAATKWLPGSVMNERGGTAIDDLTRVLVGWDDTLTPAAVSFLEDTRHVTVEEINDALAEA